MMIAPIDAPRQLDMDLLDYVGQLREGILEAYQGIVTGFKNTDKSKTISTSILIL